MVCSQITQQPTLERYLYCWWQHSVFASMMRKMEMKWWRVSVHRASLLSMEDAPELGFCNKSDSRNCMIFCWMMMDDLFVLVFWGEMEKGIAIDWYRFCGGVMYTILMRQKSNRQIPPETYRVDPGQKPWNRSVIQSVSQSGVAVAKKKQHKKCGKKDGKRIVAVRMFKKAS